MIGTVIQTNAQPTKRRVASRINKIAAPPSSQRSGESMAKR